MTPTSSRRAPLALALLALSVAASRGLAQADVETTTQPVFPLPVGADARWVRIARTAEATWYADTALVIRHPHLVRVWLRADYAEPHTEARLPGTPFTRLLLLTDVSCTSTRWRAWTHAFFPAAGQRPSTVTAMHGRNWSPFSGDSVVGADGLKALCRLVIAATAGRSYDPSRATDFSTASPQWCGLPPERDDDRTLDRGWNDHRTGQLPFLDCRSTSGTFADQYRLVVDQRARVTIALESRDFDPYLILVSNGRVIAQDDDSGPDLDARITVDLARGTYLVRATSLLPGRGAYKITVLR